MKAIRVIIAVVVLAIMLAILPAGAATITQTKTFDGTPDYIKELMFNKFDPSKGTLNSITVIFNMAINGGYLIVDNDGDEPATVTVALGATGSISSTDVTLLNSSFQPLSLTTSLSTGQTFNLGANSGDIVGVVDPSAPDGATHYGGSINDSRNGLVDPLFFSGYTGAGTYIVNANANQILNFGSVGGVEGAFAPVSTNGSVQITYDYDPVPEPSSMVAMLAGLGGLAGLIRRRRNR